ncbi:MAG: glycosyltransferase, partial [Gammaproteobacteria bacterium]|nr:glycosyltransferase [Gammaproteobacteria bacterium]
MIHSNKRNRQSPKMNLAFALFTYFPFGGLTRDMTAIARACRRRGHRVRVYAGACRGPVDDDLEVQIVPSNALTNPGKNRRFARRLPDVVAAFSPRLIIGFNKMPGLDLYYAADDC